MAFAAVVAVAAVFHAGPAIAADDPAIVLANSMNAAWDRGDANVFGEQYWPDARFVNVLAHVYEGRDAIVAQHAHIFATLYKGSHNVFTVAHRQMLGTDHELAEFDGAMTGWTRLPPGVVTVDGAIRSHFVLVLERRRGEWKIAYAQNTAYTPLPAPPPGH